MNIILQATKIRQQQDALETDAQDPPWKKSCITQKVFIYFWWKTPKTIIKFYNTQTKWIIHIERLLLYFLGFLKQCCREKGVPNECVGLCAHKPTNETRKDKMYPNKCNKFNAILKTCIAKSEGNLMINCIKYFI